MLPRLLVVLRLEYLRQLILDDPAFVHCKRRVLLRVEENLEILARVVDENHEIGRRADLEIADNEARVGVDDFVHALARYRVFSNDLELAAADQQADHAIGRLAARIEQRNVSNQDVPRLASLVGLRKAEHQERTCDQKKLRSPRRVHHIHLLFRH